jgi:predicted kinase
MRRKFVAVIGYRNSGKSTIIRSLTGCESRSFIGEVQDNEANLSIFVHAPSPQERGKVDKKVFENYLQKAKKGQRIQGLVFAIQPTIPNRRLSMEEMFSLARQGGFECYAFILEDPYKGKRIENFENIKSRVLDSAPDARVFALDGRRFAVLNAETIRSLSRLPY